MIDLATDASSRAIGAYYHGDWAYFSFHTDLPWLEHFHINFKEVFALVLAAELWTPWWPNSKVIWRTDSKVALGMVNKGTCRNPKAMRMMRRLFWLSAIYNFEIQAVHIAGAINHIPDAISRLQEPKQWKRLEALIGAKGLLPLCDHMSYHSYLCTLFPQVQQGRHPGQNWKPG